MFTALNELSKFQTYVMEFVQYWVREEKTPVPLKEIKKHMKTQGVNDPSIRDAVRALIKKGYIRKSASLSNIRKYVQIRSI